MIMGTLTSATAAAAASSSSSSSPSSSPWIPSSSLLRISSSRFSKKQPFPPPSSSGCRVVCRGGSHPQFAASDLKFLLHGALDSFGIDTTLAREARQGFLSQIQKLSNIERETSISINRCVDLGKTALYIAAEDDSLISHSSVPLPVDAFIERLDDLSMGYCSNYSSSFRTSPENFLDSLEKYLYVKKNLSDFVKHSRCERVLEAFFTGSDLLGFRRSEAGNQLEPRSLYLHSVLTHRSGSPVLLSLIYSEILKMLRLWGLLDFDCEIFFPHDLHGLPRGYRKQKSKESDQPHIMTSQAMLEEILRNLKEAFWPFQLDHAKSLFLRAAHAANYIDRSNSEAESGFQLASAKAAQYRLERGVWTGVRFGDMRRALSACERLIQLESDPRELRDYSILLYHCGFYEQSLQYLKLYQETKSSSLQKQPATKLTDMEENAVENLMIRLNLILMEQGWSKPAHVRNFLGNNSEPW